MGTVTFIGHPHGNRPGDVYPCDVEPPCERIPETVIAQLPAAIEDRPYVKMINSGKETVELKLCTRERLILQMELDYSEMAQFYEVVSKALLYRIRKQG